MSRIADPALWRSGAERLAHARAYMPVTTALAQEAAAAGTVRGVRIAVSDVLEPKTANLATLLAEAGADVAVSCVGRDTDDAVAAALVHAGIPVYARASDGPREDRENALLLLDHRPEVIVDDGAGVIRLAHTARTENLDVVVGATEQTTSGVRPLRTMAREGELRFPVIAGNDARTKSLFDNAHGTGQAVVFAIADLLDIPLAGLDVVVAGFGRVGSGIARHVTALGGRVTIAEVDPVAALQAAFAGYPVEPLATAATHADLLISATGVAHTVALEHLITLPDGAAVAVGGGVAQEISLDAARAVGAQAGAKAGKVAEWTLPNGRRVRVLDDGNCINVSAAEGNPIQVMDLSFGVQLSAVLHLLDTRGTLAAGVHALPRSLDDRVAALALTAFGGTLDTTSPDQRAFLTSWQPASDGEEEIR